MIYGKEKEKKVGPSLNINNNSILWMFNGPNYKVAFQKNEGWMNNITLTLIVTS